MRATPVRTSAARLVTLSALLRPTSPRTPCPASQTYLLSLHTRAHCFLYPHSSASCSTTQRAGYDTAQMVHSVLTDACDSSGAMWWMLRKKAERRRWTNSRGRRVQSQGLWIRMRRTLFQVPGNRQFYPKHRRLARRRNSKQIPYSTSLPRGARSCARFRDRPAYIHRAKPKPRSRRQGHITNPACRGYHHAVSLPLPDRAAAAVQPQLTE